MCLLCICLNFFFSFWSCPIFLTPHHLFILCWWSWMLWFCRVWIWLLDCQFCAGRSAGSCWCLVLGQRGCRADTFPRPDLFGSVSCYSGSVELQSLRHCTPHCPFSLFLQLATGLCQAFWAVTFKEIIMQIWGAAPSSLAPCSWDPGRTLDCDVSTPPPHFLCLESSLRQEVRVTVDLTSPFFSSMSVQGFCPLCENTALCLFPLIFGSSKG